LRHLIQNLRLVLFHGSRHVKLVRLEILLFLESLYQILKLGQAPVFNVAAFIYKLIQWVERAYTFSHQGTGGKLGLSS
jgi:hypothetical protein